MLSPHDRQVVCERLLGKYVIKHIYEVKLWGRDELKRLRPRYTQLIGFATDSAIVLLLGANGMMYWSASVLQNS
jgi:hypothetical protein